MALRASSAGSGRYDAQFVRLPDRSMTSARRRARTAAFGLDDQRRAPVC